MNDTTFQNEVKTLQEHIQQAILKGEPKAIPPAARELRRYWVMALFRQNRVDFKLVNDAILAISAMANSFKPDNQGEHPLAVWSQALGFLGEAGTLMQRMHTDWTAEDRWGEATAHLANADQSILFFEQKGMVTFANFVQHMGEMLVSSRPGAGNDEKERECRQHLRLLMDFELVDRNDWDLYYLTTLGEQVAILLKKKQQVFTGHADFPAKFIAWPGISVQTHDARVVLFAGNV
ncbi:MAG: hypothetical protein HQL55_11980 [Magnetococcales bacterium]|nr:hypothetical protein [Magnetococcales bacterium]